MPGVERYARLGNVGDESLLQWIEVWVVCW